VHHRGMDDRAPDDAAGALLARLQAGDSIPAVTSVLEIPAMPKRVGSWPSWAPTEVRQALAGIGIQELYPHQSEAADDLWHARHVALATGTASGKSIAYLLPAMSAMCDAPPGREPTLLYISPTKALARDQLRRMEELHFPALRCAAYDGDSPPEERRWARRHANVVVTNPDMLHRGILPRHEAWVAFLRRLRFVVVDEFHTYRGVLGSHLAAVLRRLRRVAEHYGAQPTFLGASATIADPGMTLSQMIGVPAKGITHDQAARGRTTLAIWQPRARSWPHSGPGPPAKASLISETSELLAQLVGQGVRTLAFVRSRRAAEVVAARTQRILDDRAPHLSERVASYRSGYLPEERRELEVRLRDGLLLGLAATSALELGIDVAGVDAVLIAGWPGTRASLRQRMGRAGRGLQPSLAIFIPDDDPLDSFLASHPEQILAESEGIVLDPDNPYVLAGHLCAAAAEIPINEEDATCWFGPEAPGLLETLQERGFLRRRRAAWFWVRPQRPADLVDIRGSNAEPVSVIEEDTARLIASVDAGAADRTVHEGAVYTHQGADHLIVGYSPEDCVAMARRTALPYSTQALTDSETRIRRVEDSQDWGAVGVRFGTVEVNSTVVGFLKRRQRTGEVIGREPLDMARHTLTTRAVWWEIPSEVLEAADIEAMDVGGAAHGAEHAAIGMLPLLAQCDRWDIGGLSTERHPDTGHCTIFVYDGQAGGAGFARRGYLSAQKWLTSTVQAVASCPCESGCPSCIQSPKCGNGNEPLDKAAAIRLLNAVLASAPR